MSATKGCVSRWDQCQVSLAHPVGVRRARAQAWTPPHCPGQMRKEQLAVDPVGTNKGGAQHPAWGHIVMESLSLLHRAALMVCWLKESGDE